MDHAIREKLKAHLASLRARFGHDDPDVKALATIVEEPDAPAVQPAKHEGP